MTDRQGRIELVAAAADTNAARMGKAFAAAFAPYRTGTESMPNVSRVFRWIERARRRTGAILVAAGDAHNREPAGDAAPAGSPP